MRNLRVGAMVVGLLVGLMAGAVRAEEGIVVTGTGVAKAKPTQVEIECTLSGEAELAADATVKFRDAKKRALAAIAGMKNPDVTVVSEGVSVNNALDANAQMMMMQGRGGGTGKPRMQIQEKSKIVLSGADKMEPDALLDVVLKILDVAKDAGFTVGSPPSNNYYEQQMRSMMGNAVVAFKVADAKGMKEEAYKAALAEAREKAEKLAALSGVKLGKVLSISEGSGKAEAGANNAMMYYAMEMMGRGANGDDGKTVAGNSTAELSMKVSLTVQFEIVK